MIMKFSLEIMRLMISLCLHTQNAFYLSTAFKKSNRYIGSNLCETGKPEHNCSQGQIEKNKMQTNTLRCFKNHGIKTTGLMCKQKSHMAHEYAGHHSRARAYSNSCISLTWYLNWHLSTLICRAFHFLSIIILKINFWHVLVKLEIPSYLIILT